MEKDANSQANCPWSHKNTQRTDVILCLDCNLFASPDMKQGITQSQQRSYEKGPQIRNSLSEEHGNSQHHHWQ